MKAIFHGEAFKRGSENRVNFNEQTNKNYTFSHEDVDTAEGSELA